MKGRHERNWETDNRYTLRGQERHSFQFPTGAPGPQGRGGRGRKKGGKKDEYPQILEWVNQYFLLYQNSVGGGEIVGIYKPLGIHSLRRNYVKKNV